MIASLPRADSPSADRYVREREGETAWTMHLRDGLEAGAGPSPTVLSQITEREHVSHQYGGRVPGEAKPFDPNARAWDEDLGAELPANFRMPNLDE